MKMKQKNSYLKMWVGLCAAVIMFGLLTGSAWAHDVTPHPHAEDSKVGNTKHVDPEHGGLGNVGAKLANPLGDLWSLNFNISLLTASNGDINQGDAQFGSFMIAQPVMPIPLYGEGKNEWRILLRPVVPIIFSTPVPRGDNSFYNRGGIGDIQLPFVLSLPNSITKNWIIGAGPVFEFPTATNDDLGADQISMGPAVALGYHTKKWTAVLFPNYFMRIADKGQGDRPNTSKGTLFYSFLYNLANGWQVGTNPTISYNDNGSSGNKWTVPVGLTIGKTIKIGNMPVNFKIAAEYSVVSPDDFGQVFGLRIHVIPVIKGLIQKPIFGTGK
jgi:hypothetical protein